MQVLGIHVSQVLENYIAVHYSEYVLHIMRYIFIINTRNYQRCFMSINADWEFDNYNFQHFGILIQKHYLYFRYSTKLCQVVGSRWVWRPSTEVIAFSKLWFSTLSMKSENDVVLFYVTSHLKTAFTSLMTSTLHFYLKKRAEDSGNTSPWWQPLWVHSPQKTPGDRHPMLG